MSMEQNAMYPSNETSWECDAIAWTSESDTELQTEEKQCMWKLKKRQWKPKVDPTKICDHFTNIHLQPKTRQHHQDDDWGNNTLSYERCRKKEEQVHKQCKRDATQNKEREENADRPTNYIEQRQGRLSLTLENEKNGRCASNEFGTKREIENDDPSEALNMGQSIESIASIEIEERQNHKPRNIKTRRRMTERFHLRKKSFFIPGLGKMSSLRSNKNWDSGASQSLASGDESTSGTEHSWASDTSFDKYFQGFGVENETRGKRYCAQTRHASSSDTSQDSPPRRRRLIRKINKRLDPVETDEWDSSDLCKSDQEHASEHRRGKITKFMKSEQSQQTGLRMESCSPRIEETPPHHTQMTSKGVSTSRRNNRISRPCVPSVRNGKMRNKLYATLSKWLTNVKYKAGSNDDSEYSSVPMTLWNHGINKKWCEPKYAKLTKILGGTSFLASTPIDQKMLQSETIGRNQDKVEIFKTLSSAKEMCDVIDRRTKMYESYKKWVSQL